MAEKPKTPKRPRQARRNYKNNSTGFRGVYYDKRESQSSRPYYSRIKVNGKSVYLGNFKTAGEASREFKRAEIELEETGTVESRQRGGKSK